jgi:hypothetical protein|tara:strand:- start:6173 stop:7528 length:1356 start_codon:yes stop_codon:yes gene_type:complete
MVSLNYYYLARNILKRGRRKNIPLLLVSLFLIAGHFAVEYSNARNIYGDVQNADWQAVNSWILSSSCSADTGAFLVSCQSDGSLAPYEDISLADDIGHALALNLYSAFTGIEAEFYQAARVNVLLNFVSAGILAMLLYFSLGAFSAFVFSAFVPFAYASLIYLSPHPALTGVASLSVAAVIIPLLWLGKCDRFLPFFSITVSVFVLVGTAAVFRTAIAYYVLAASALVWSLVVIKSGTKKNIFRNLICAGAVLTSIIAALSVPNGVRSLRDQLFNVRPAAMNAGHGISHNLYIGVGDVENSFGVEWSDTYGYNVVKEVAPGVAYASPAYFQVLWSEYWELWNDDPWEMISVYLRKAFKMFSGTVYDRIPVGLISLSVVLSGVLVALSFLRHGHGLSPKRSIVLCSGALTAAFFAQGILANTSMFYFSATFPIVLIGVIAIISSIIKPSTQE